MHKYFNTSKLYVHIYKYVYNSWAGELEQNKYIISRNSNVGEPIVNGKNQLTCAFRLRLATIHNTKVLTFTQCLITQLNNFCTSVLIWRNESTQTSDRTWHTSSSLIVPNIDLTDKYWKMMYHWDP